MKKLVFMFVAIATVSFASCGSNNSAAAVDTDSVAAQDTVAADTTVADSAVADSAAADSVVAE